jgi:hypothetical protein
MRHQPGESQGHNRHPCRRTVFLADAAIPVVGLTGVRVDAVRDLGEASPAGPPESGQFAVPQDLAEEVDGYERSQKRPSGLDQCIQERHGEVRYGSSRVLLARVAFGRGPCPCPRGTECLK